MRGLSGSSKYLYCIMIRTRVNERGGEAEDGGDIERPSVYQFLLRTAKFSIQHVSPVMERGKEGEEARERERGRERLTVAR